MNDIIDVIDDLRELQHLYASQDLCYIDFEEKLQKYQAIVEDFEKEFENEYAGC